MQLPHKPPMPLGVNQYNPRYSLGHDNRLTSGISGLPVVNPSGIGGLPSVIPSGVGGLPAVIPTCLRVISADNDCPNMRGYQNL